MEIFTGGTAQGKLTYVLKNKDLKQSDVTDGTNLELDPPEGIRVLNHFEIYIRRILAAGLDPYAIVQKLKENNPGILIVSTEIGSGVIPVDPKEREWRETTGRLLCKLAEDADEVTRIICGIGQIIKDKKNSSRYFRNINCRYFPCHRGISEDNFNCLFCYCPLYALGEDCGGNFTYTKNGIKDCTGCVRPHLAENYDEMTEGCRKLVEVTRKK